MVNNEITPDISFKFNEKKTTQAASLFLKKSGGKMSYMKLIKLLYLADRQALSLWERPLTGDIYFSMKRGPVLSNVLDIINNGDDPENNSYWYKYIDPPKNYDVKLKEKELPETDTLSQREMDLIDELSEKFKDLDRWDMVKFCHDFLPEWEEDVGDSRKLIEISNILKEVDKSPDEIKAIKEEVSNLNYVKDKLSIDD